MHNTSFGVKAGLAHFQRRVCESLVDLPWLTTSQDDVSVRARTFYEFHLRVNGPKNVIGSSALPYLGLVVSSRSLRFDPSRVTALAELSPPASRTNSDHFLGCATYAPESFPALLTSPRWPFNTAVCAKNLIGLGPLVSASPLPPLSP